MKVKYIKKEKPNAFHNPYFTFGKEYEVIADYRLRQSGQRLPDNGFVIKDDMNQEKMVFLDEFEITDNSIGNTFVFIPNAE